MTTWSEDGFAELLDEIESLLGDLYGVEAAAEAVLDYAYAEGSPAKEVHPKAPITLSLPAQKAFDVHPMLPTVEDFDYQSWITGCFENGKLKAAATSAWLKNIATNYYLVDAQAIISASLQQSAMTHAEGVKINEIFKEVSGNMFAHWEGEAQEAFGEWFAVATGAVSALLWYADSAQLSAGAAADVIAATQKSLMRQAEIARDTLKEAVDTWREDNDVFPFPPGSGFKFEQLGAWVSSKVDPYVDAIPAGDFIVDKAIGAVGTKVPPVAAALEGYSLLVSLDANDTDPKTPATASEIITDLEDAFTTLCQDGDTATQKLAPKIKKLAQEVAASDVLVLPRLPRDPRGPYDPY